MNVAASLDVDLIVAGEHGQPFEVLGPHVLRVEGQPVLVIRAFVPRARSLSVVRGRTEDAMKRVHPAGFFEVVFPGVDTAFEYTLVAKYADGAAQHFEDPYALPPVLGDLDLHLFQEGTHYQLHARIGAQVIKHVGHRGVSFAVWAPNAKRVSVIGGFNRWDERAHPMRLRGTSGIWELFVPGLESGELYKYHIKTRLQNANSVRTDPVGFYMEQRPNTASIVWDRRRPFRWHDDKWRRERTARQAPSAPISIYEVHLGSWMRAPDAESAASTRKPARARAAAGRETGRTDAGRWLTYRELARTLVPYAKRMGYTHLELLPITEHPLDGSWGYQTVGYFAPTSRFGTPEDFKFFVDAAHRAGLGVILDWVPAHFPRDGHGLGFFDGTHLYEYADPRKGEHQDWGTLIYDYGCKQVVEFLLSSALYWLEEMHLDGMRVDAVASMLYLNYSRKDGEWEPNVLGGPENLEAVAFVRRFNELVHQQVPGVLTFAEESTTWPGVSRPVAKGGLGFDLKWNMGWMNDTLQYVKEDPLARKHHHNKLTFSIMYAFSENFILPLSHDEVVHGKRSLWGKMPGDEWKKRATLRALLGYMFAHPGKKLLFMGGEIGQKREWSHERQLDWELLQDPGHAALQAFARDLNRLYKRTPALHEVDFAPAGFEWIEARDESRSVVCFLRRGIDPRDLAVVAINWTPVPWEAYRMGVPEAGSYRVLLDSDAVKYGGSGTVQRRTIPSTPVAAQGHAQSIELTLPPLGALFLAPYRDPAPGQGRKPARGA